MQPLRSLDPPVKPEDDMVWVDHSFKPALSEVEGLHVTDGHIDSDFRA